MCRLDQRLQILRPAVARIRRGFDLELAPADLVAITGAVTATIGR